MGCAIKHFVANESEFERHTISSELDERTLRELYLLPFEMAVRRAGTLSVMAAYNRLNGTYCAEHDQLASVLDEWGFDGFMISDWWGTKSTTATARHGVDLEMPGPAVFLGAQLADAIRSGEALESDLDDKLRRLLGVMERLGVLDSDELGAEESLDVPEHRQVLRRAAQQAVVLLKNDPLPSGADDPTGSPVLPIRPGTVSRIAVIGPNADVHLVQGGGSAAVNPHRSLTILDGLRERYGADVEIVSARGCDAYRNLPPLDHRWIRGGADASADASAEARFRLEYFSGREFAGDPIATEFTPAPRLIWLGTPHPDVTAGDFSMRLSATFVAPETGSFEFSMIVGGSGRVLIDGELALDMWDEFLPGDAFFGMGSAEIRARVEVVEGQELEILAEFRCIEGLGAAAFLLGGLPVIEEDALSIAAAAAASADVAIVVVGLNQDWETEGGDRLDWLLPGDQEALIEAVAAVQPRTAVLVQAGSPVGMEWEPSVPAVAQLWYLGQETGTAVADLVSGDVSPSGRLPTTFPDRFEDHPAFENYPGEFGTVRYGEGLFMGYRYYDHRELPPRYCFGHGLGYEPTEISDLELRRGDSPGTVLVSVTVRNLGTAPTAEVVQVYVGENGAAVARPVRELKAFCRVELGAGDAAELELVLDERAFQHWDPTAHDWVTGTGEFTVFVGRSSRDLELVAPWTPAAT